MRRGGGTQIRKETRKSRWRNDTNSGLIFANIREILPAADPRCARAIRIFLLFGNNFISGGVRMRRNIRVENFTAGEISERFANFSWVVCNVRIARTSHTRPHSIRISWPQLCDGSSMLLGTLGVASFPVKCRDGSTIFSAPLLIICGGGIWINVSPSAGCISRDVKSLSIP